MNILMYPTRINTQFNRAKRHTQRRGYRPEGDCKAQHTASETFIMKIGASGDPAMPSDLTMDRLLSRMNSQSICVSPINTKAGKITKNGIQTLVNGNSND